MGRGIPERAARSRMLELHLGDTPHPLSPGDFDALGLVVARGVSELSTDGVDRLARAAARRRCVSARYARRAWRGESTVHKPLGSTGVGLERRSGEAALGGVAGVATRDGGRAMDDATRACV